MKDFNTIPWDLSMFSVSALRGTPPASVLHLDHSFMALISSREGFMQPILLNLVFTVWHTFFVLGQYPLVLIWIGILSYTDVVAKTRSYSCGSLKSIDHAQAWCKVYLSTKRWLGGNLKYSFKFHPMGCLKDQWKIWCILHQGRDQSMSDYTIEFLLSTTIQWWWQFIIGLYTQINTELSLFKVHDISSGSGTTMIIKRKYITHNERIAKKVTKKSFRNDKSPYWKMIKIWPLVKILSNLCQLDCVKGYNSSSTLISMPSSSEAKIYQCHHHR